MRLDGFTPAEEAMIHQAVADLQTAGYDTNPIQVLLRAELPAGYRGMSWPDGAVLGSEAFASQAILDHVLEEELVHLQQAGQGKRQEYGPETAHSLEGEVDEQRRFPNPEC